MASQIEFLGFLLVQLAVICTVFVALCDIVQRVFRLDRLLTFSATVFALGLMGYACFCIAYANYALFGLLKIALLTGLILYFAFIAYRRELARHRWLAEPLFYTILFTAAVLALCFSNGGLDDPGRAVQLRFGYLGQGDNLISRAFGDFLRQPSLKLDTDWLSSDRPPLQTGLYLFLTLQTGGMGYQIVATWLQATFLLGVWATAAAMNLTTQARRMVLFACCMLPTTIINTYYTWPKMLSVGYLMIVFALLFCYRPQALRDSRTLGVLIGGAAVLAMLSHGGAAFALIGFGIVIVAAWQWPSWRAILSGGATFALLYAPWLAYQKFIDPPGNRLLKWHLAGVMQVDPRSLFEALHDTYRSLTWDEYVRGRIANFAVMIGDWPQHLWNITKLVFDYDPVLTRTVHMADFLQLLPSLHVFSLAMIPAMAMLPFIRKRHQRRAAMLLLMAFVATSITVAIVLITPGGAINHLSSYALQILATMFIVCVFSSLAPAGAWVLIALQSVTVVTAYGFVIEHDARFWPLWVACVAATLALLVYSLAPTVHSAKTATTAQS